LRRNGVTAVHDERPGAHDTSRLIVFKWDAPAESAAAPPKIELYVELQLLSHGNAHRFALKVRLEMKHAGVSQSVDMALPELADEAEVTQRMLGILVDAFGQLAMDITSGSSKAEKE
jgi:hypothetical protein